MNLDAIKLINRLLLAFVTFITTSAAFEGYFVKWAFRDPDFVSWLDGTTFRPWVYRRLLPDSARAFHDLLLDIDVASTIDFLSDNNFLAWKFRQPQITPDIIVEYYFIYAAAFIFFFASIMLWRRLASQAIDNSIAGTLGALLFALLMPLLLTAGGYPYDFSELFFFTTALLLATHGHCAALIALTLPAEFNKESFLFFLPTLYPFLRRHCSQSKTCATLATSILIAGLTYLKIRADFADNPGATVIFFCDTNLQYLFPIVVLLIAYFVRKKFSSTGLSIAILAVGATIFTSFADRQTIIADYFFLEHTYGTISGERLFFLHVGMILWLIKSTWTRLPEDWRRHASLAAAINFPLWILFCAPGELRNLSMLYPTLVVMLSVYIKGVLRR